MRSAEDLFGILNNRIGIREGVAAGHRYRRRMSIKEVPLGDAANLPHAAMTAEIIAAAIEVHRHLGPGLLESAYRMCLVQELRGRSLNVEIERPVPLLYKGIRIAEGYRADLVVDDRILVELKAVDRILPIHEAQLLTYLRLLHREVGLLLNFHAPTLRKGLRRLVLQPLPNH